MKKAVLLLATFLLLGALVIVYLPFTPAQPQQPVMGADRDTHNCIASAGYTYSAIRGECIRLWEAGIALMPVVQIEDPVLAAYVVQDKDGHKAEVFVPGFEQGIVMKRAENTGVSIWKGPEGWTLTYSPDQKWELLQYGQLIYASKES